MSHEEGTVPYGTPVPDWSGMIPEECPHCDQPHPAGEMDRHVTTVHADLPPCTAALDDEHYDGTLHCVLRTGHRSGHGEYGDYHVSARGPVGRTVWNDTAAGATPHKEPS